MIYFTILYCILYTVYCVLCTVYCTVLYCCKLLKESHDETK